MQRVDLTTSSAEFLAVFSSLERIVAVPWNVRRILDHNFNTAETLVDLTSLSRVTAVSCSLSPVRCSSRALLPAKPFPTVSQVGLR